MKNFESYNLGELSVKDRENINGGGPGAEGAGGILAICVGLACVSSGVGAGLGAALIVEGSIALANAIVNSTEN